MLSLLLLACFWAARAHQLPVWRFELERHFKSLDPRSHQPRLAVILPQHKAQKHQRRLNIIHLLPLGSSVYQASHGRKMHRSLFEERMKRRSGHTQKKRALAEYKRTAQHKEHVRNVKGINLRWTTQESALPNCWQVALAAVEEIEKSRPPVQ